MNYLKRSCFLAGPKDSLLDEIVTGLLKDSNCNLKLHEGQTGDFEEMLNEIHKVKPDVVLLNESSPFSMDSFLMRLLIARPGLPVIVISEQSNIVHIVHRETRLLNTSNDLLATINFVQARQ